MACVLKRNLTFSMNPTGTVDLTIMQAFGAYLMTSAITVSTDDVSKKFFFSY